MSQVYQVQRLVDDGFGNVWECCTPGCNMEIVRPGKIQCEKCDHNSKKCDCTYGDTSPECRIHGVLR